MKISRILLLILAVCTVAVFAGCGSKPSKDDSDVSETMTEVYDTEYFTLSQLIGIEPIPDTDDTAYTYLRTKYLTHEVDIDLTYKGEVYPIYAVMELIKSEDVVVKGIENEFFVVFDDGHISKVITDKNILAEGVTKANILEEDILCMPKMTTGLDWYSTNGYYSVVDRYEYVVLDDFKKTAPSFKVSTYRSDDTVKSNLVRIVWWCPDLGWCVQWQDYEKGTYEYLTDFNFDWDED